MLKQIKARVDEKNWIRCGNCSHKFGRIIGAGYCDPSPILEMKCNSCKFINTWSYDGYKKVDIF